MRLHGQCASGDVDMVVWRGTGASRDCSTNQYYAASVMVHQVIDACDSCDAEAMFGNVTNGNKVKTVSISISS